MITVSLCQSTTKVFDFKDIVFSLVFDRPMFHLLPIFMVWLVLMKRLAHLET